MKPYENKFPWDLDWNLLRTFVVLVEQNGISKAAHFLGLTQPSLSNSLKRLEQAAGNKLVERSPGYFRITPAGKLLYRECSAIFGSVTQIPGLLSEAEERVDGHITMVMTSHIVSPHFDEVLCKFSSLHKDVTFSMSVVESSEVIDRVQNNRASLGLCLMSKEITKIRDNVLYRESIGLYCGPSHRLFGRKDIKLNDLEGEKSVAFQTEVEGGPLASVRKLRERLSLDQNIRAISANLPEIRRMIVVGAGIGALPVHVARRDVEAGLLWPLPPRSKLPSVDMFYLVNPARNLSPGEKILITMLDDLVNGTSLASRTYD